jgi:hypothetical protein
MRTVFPWYGANSSSRRVSVFTGAWLVLDQATGGARTSKGATSRERAACSPTLSSVAGSAPPARATPRQHFVAERLRL